MPSDRQMAVAHQRGLDNFRYNLTSWLYHQYGVEVFNTQRRTDGVRRVVSIDPTRSQSWAVWVTYDDGRKEYRPIPGDLLKQARKAGKRTWPTIRAELRDALDEVAWLRDMEEGETMEDEPSKEALGIKEIKYAVVEPSYIEIPHGGTRTGKIIVRFTFLDNDTLIQENVVHVFNEHEVPLFLDFLRSQHDD